MRFEQRWEVEQAFRLMFDAVSPYQGVLKIEDVRVGNAINKMANSLIVKVSSTEKEHTTVAGVLVEFTKALKRQCYEFYQYRGFLLIPSVEMTEPTPAAEA